MFRGFDNLSAVLIVQLHSFAKQPTDIQNEPVFPAPADRSGHWCPQGQVVRILPISARVLLSVAQNELPTSPQVNQLLSVTS